ALEQRTVGEVFSVEVENVEDVEDGRGGRPRALQEGEAGAVPLHGHDLAVEDDVVDRQIADGGGDPGEPGVERLPAARPQVHRRAAPDGDAAEAVELALVHPPVPGR